jgi:16S rRNA processing protein RimM
MTMPAFADLVLVGRVVKPHGRRGEVAVDPLSDREDRFPGLARAFAPATGGASRELRVEGCFKHQDRFVLKLAGIDSIEAAETLRGAELRIEESELAALPEGSYYHYQLVGLRVDDERGEPIGVVESVMETGAATRVLVLREPRGGETLLPFAEAFVRSVDLAAGRIVAARPEYVVAD